MSKNRRNNWIMAALALSLLVGTTTISSCSSENVPEEPERPGANEAPSTLEIAGEHDVWMWTITLKENKNFLMRLATSPIRWTGGKIFGFRLKGKISDPAWSYEQNIISLPSVLK